MKTVIYKARYIGKRPPKRDKAMEALRRKLTAQYFKAWGKKIDRLYCKKEGK